MMEIVNFFILFFSMIMHEIGHYLAFISLGVNPNIRFTWYGVVIGENVFYNLNPGKAIYVSITGFIAGLILLYLFNLNVLYFLLYLLMSSIDIGNIISFMSIKDKHWNKSLIKIAKIQLKELEKKLKQVNGK